MPNSSKLARNTRINRRIHKWLSLPFVVFMLIIGVTALLLAWKKEAGLIPKTQKTKIEQPGEWISLEDMIAIGIRVMEDSLEKSSLIDRVDVRPDKGIAKIVFKHHFTEVQVDGYTGEVLSIAQRNSDLIERIHDGSILDFVVQSSSENSKLIYSTLTSLALVGFSISGFFLWYYPKKIKQAKFKRLD